MKYEADILVNDLYDQTEKLLNKAIRDWQNMPADILNSQPEKGKWSAAQCLEHLNSYGRYYLPAIEHAIKNAGSTTSARVFQSGFIGNYFYKLMLTGETGVPKTKMKAPKEHQPPKELDAAKVVAEFINQNERLQELLIQSKKIDLNKARVPITIAKFIKLKLGDVFLFLVAHNNRHVMQAEKALHRHSSEILQ